MKHSDTKEHPLDRHLGWLYDRVTGEEDARVCKDIPESACHHQPRNFFAYLLANSASKVADELSSARLILPWLLSALGAPMALVGFLVPIREAGVLLPQLLVAAVVRRMARRKVVWLIGASLSAASLLLMAVIAWRFEGALAGSLLIGCLIVYSLARGLCSVSAKDVLGKTVSKTRRGTLMGYASGISGLAVLGLGVYLVVAQTPDDDPILLSFFLLLAALLWLVGLFSFAAIAETPGATEGGGNALAVAVKQMAIVKNDRHFRRFLWARAWLLSIALLPPFYVVLVQQYGGSFLGLGGLIIASGLAAAISAPIWGRLSDRSSRCVMMLAALISAILGTTLWLLDRFQGISDNFAWLTIVAYFILMICHGGVRLGRKAYLVDMATTDNRASYVAVSNTVIGIVMLAGGLVGALGDIWNTVSVIGLLSLLAAIAMFQLTRLPEIQGT